MNPRINLLVSLVNLKKTETLRQDLQKIFVDFGISTGDSMRPDNLIRSKDNSQIFFLSDFSNENRRDGVIFPGDDGFDDGLWASVEEIQEEAERILGNFADEKPVDTAWLSKLFIDTADKNFFEPDPIDELNLNFIPVKPAKNLSFYNAVLRFGLVDFFIRGEGREFRRIRRCRNCGTFFFAKDLRRIFCTTRCKNSHITLDGYGRPSTGLEELRLMKADIMEYQAQRDRLKQRKNEEGETS
jgi:hypothetical protein